MATITNLDLQSVVILTDAYGNPPVVVHDSLIRAASPYMNELLGNEPLDGEVRRLELQYDALLQTGDLSDIGIYVRWLYGVKLKDIFPIRYGEQVDEYEVDKYLHEVGEYEVGEYEVGEYARLYLSACGLEDKKFTNAVMDCLITAIEEATLLSKTSDSAVRAVVHLLYQKLCDCERPTAGRQLVLDLAVHLCHRGLYDSLTPLFEREFMDDLVGALSRKLANRGEGLDPTNPFGAKCRDYHEKIRDGKYGDMIEHAILNMANGLQR